MISSSPSRLYSCQPVPTNQPNPSSIRSLYPYLFFTNTTREAMTRYYEFLGGQLETPA